jgi:hypothetical protein
MIQENGTKVGDWLISTGNKNIRWGSQESAVTHKQVLAPLGTFTTVGAAGMFALSVTQNVPFPPFETTAQWLIDHTEEIKDRCLLFTDMANNSQTNIEGRLINSELLAESTLPVNTPEYSETATEIAERILTPNTLNVLETCGDDPSTGEIIKTTIQERHLAQNVLKTISEAQKPFNDSFNVFLGSTFLLGARALRLHVMGWLNKRVTYSSSITWLGEQQVRIGNRINAPKAS